MTRIGRIFTDLFYKKFIRFNPLNPRHPHSILLFLFLRLSRLLWLNNLRDKIFYLNL